MSRPVLYPSGPVPVRRPRSGPQSSIAVAGMVRMAFSGLYELCLFASYNSKTNDAKQLVEFIEVEK